MRKTEFLSWPSLNLALPVVHVQGVSLVAVCQALAGGATRLRRRGGDSVLGPVFQASWAGPKSSSCYS